VSPKSGRFLWGADPLFISSFFQHLFIDGIYALGRYNERIDYTRPLSPPLPAEHAARVWELLTNRGPHP
jgi:hypothetical protein